MPQNAPIAFPCCLLLPLAFPYLLLFACPGGERSEPRWTCYPYISLPCPWFPLLLPTFPRYPVLSLALLPCSLGISFNWFPWRSLTPLAFPCFLFPALAFSSFICPEFGDDMFPIYWWWHVPHLFGKGSVIKWGTCHHQNVSRPIWNMSSPNFFPNTSRTCHHQLCWAMLALAGFC